MFGIVDEYGVLENEQVFIQYSSMRQNKLYRFKEEDENDMKPKVITGKVVVTKNPCHHPGDLRIFDAVDRVDLHDLVDVIVFPQKGPRPHPNQISGSDLDGDEYVVIWLKDLIPTTPNEDAHNYDSQEDPPKMNRPITRDDINQIVMEVTYADKEKEGIKSKVCTDLVGWISQEVNAAKTGKLYRSARRATNGWVRAISNYGNARHIQEALTLTSDPNKKDQENDETITKMDISPNYTQTLDPYIKHKDYQHYIPEIKRLYRIYQSDLLEIISRHRFHDEIDLLCRCDSIDASAGGKKGSIGYSAAIEVKNLIQRTVRAFFAEFDEHREKYYCCAVSIDLNTARRKIYDCDTCESKKQAKAACAYIYTYEKSNRLPPKSTQRILSYPWLFSKYLIGLKYLNRSEYFVDRSDNIMLQACVSYLNEFKPTFKVFIPTNPLNLESVDLYYEEIKEKSSNNWLIKQKVFGNECKETDQKPLIPESIWHELIIHFLTGTYQSDVRVSSFSKYQNSIMEQYCQIIKNYCHKWSNTEAKELYEMFGELHSLTIEHTKRTESTVWAYLDEYIILALQCIGIEKQLVDKWILPNNSI
ncbi:unnamed protein product [Adineta steineri]|uniref:RNA-dependent RNA polymerase n=1 Tax=Adineta steineri TaxID=433720 RepID=A0A818Q9A5_9BILA|nr:unnamed protein product [Adineta steineri]